MLRSLRLLFCLIVRLFRSRRNLLLENLALRQQLMTLKRRNPKPRFSDLDRLFWVMVRRTWAKWREALMIVTPETVVGWHRAGFRLYWRWRSQHQKALGRQQLRPFRLWDLAQFYSRNLADGMQTPNRHIFQRSNHRIFSSAFWGGAMESRSNQNFQLRILNFCMQKKMGSELPCGCLRLMIGRGMNRLLLTRYAPFMLPPEFSNAASLQRQIGERLQALAAED